MSVGVSVISPSSSPSLPLSSASSPNLSPLTSSSPIVKGAEEDAETKLCEGLIVPEWDVYDGEDEELEDEAYECMNAALRDGTDEIGGAFENDGNGIDDIKSLVEKLMGKIPIRLEKTGVFHTEVKEQLYEALEDRQSRIRKYMKT